MPNDIAMHHNFSKELNNLSYIELARELHKTGRIYALFGFLDGLSCSYGTCKWFFDLFLPDTYTLSTIHEWMSPAEIAAMAVGTVGLVIFAGLGNLFHVKNKNKYKHYIALSWPYFRHLLKGLKNAYKGLRSTLQVVELLGLTNASYLIASGGLLLGVCAALNRMLICYLISIRKGFMDKNDSFYLLLATTHVSLAELDNYQNTILSQRAHKLIRHSSLGFLVGTFGGIIDGFYLYVGVLVLSSFAPWALVAMTVFSAIYFLACIASRLYEEYTFQRNLALSQAKVELAILIHRIKQASSNGLSHEELLELVLARDNKKALIASLSAKSYALAFFTGLRNGLSVYCALACALFTFSIFFSLPPVILIASSALGVAILLACISYSLSHCSIKEIKVEEESSEQITTDEAHLTVEEKLNKLGLNKKPPPAKFFNWWEVIRSFFSGIGKGAKSFTFVVNFLKEETNCGVFILTGISASIYAIVLALRAFARGFGQIPKGEESSPAAKESMKSEIQMDVVSLNGHLIRNPQRPPNLSAKHSFSFLFIKNKIKNTEKFSSKKELEPLSIKREKPSSSKESGRFLAPDSKIPPLPFFQTPSQPCNQEITQSNALVKLNYGSYAPGTPSL